MINTGSGNRLPSRRAPALLITLITGFFCQPAAVNRFPRPEFQTPYQQLHTVFPGARPEILQYVDVALLVAALACAAWLAVFRRSRRGIVLLTIACVAYFGFVRKGCICPVGSIQNVTLAVFDSSFTLPVAVGLFFGIPLLFTLFFGRVFCSSVCPLGAVQDLVAFKPRRIAPWLVPVLGFFPHVYLGSAVLFAATGAGFIICQFDPFVGFFRLSGPPSMILAGAVLLGIGVFYARPYCTSLCPYGVLLGWMSRLSHRTVTISPDTCVNCRLCESACPFGAIVPAATAAQEPPLSRRRSLLYLHGSLFPLWIAAGVLIGMLAGPYLSMVHPAVRLARQLAAQDAARSDGRTDESLIVRQENEPVADIARDAAVASLRMERGSMILGGYLGAVIGFSLLGTVLRKRRNEYTIDHSRCLSCARCFHSCPQEHVRLENLKKKVHPVET